MRAKATADLNTEKKNLLIAQLKILKKDDYQKNLEVYKQLLALDKNNTIYQKKHDFYQIKLNKQHEIEQREAEILLVKEKVRREIAARVLL